MRSPFAILQLSDHSILLAYIYFAVFSRCSYCRLTAIVFAAWFAVPFFASLCHFYSSRHFLPCHFQRCHPFYRCSASNIAAFHSRLDLELPILLWSCRRHIHFAAKDVFVVTTSRRPIFFVAFLVVVLLVILMPSCYSYCHCSTSSNSHTVLLSKPASYSLALFSVPIKICKYTYQSFMVVSLCGYSTLVSAVKVRLRYGGNTWKVRRTYCGKILPHFQELFIIVCMHVTIYVYTLFFLFQLCISFAHTKLFGRHILFCITQVVRFKTSIA